MSSPIEAPLLVQEQLQAHHIALTDDLSPGRHDTTCPECSGQRSHAHETEVFRRHDRSREQILLELQPLRHDRPKPNGGRGQELTAYVYRDKDGIARFRKCAAAGPPPLERPGPAVRRLRRLDQGNEGVDTGILYAADEIGVAIADGHVTPGR